MELGYLLTRSRLTYPVVFSKVCHVSFCQLGNIVSLPWVIYYEAFYLHVVSSFSCIPVICLKLVLFLIPLQFVYVFCNLSECILLFFSCVSSIPTHFVWNIVGQQWRRRRRYVTVMSHEANYCCCLLSMGDRDWVDLALGRVRWRAIMNAVKKLWVSLNPGNFLTSWRTVGFPVMTLLHGVCLVFVGFLGERN